MNVYLPFADAFDDPVEPDAPVLDIRAFEEMAGELGEDGAMELVMIFESDTRDRLARMAAGGQDLSASAREMHTLKGAAGTVCCPRLAALGFACEQAARCGTLPRVEDLHTIVAVLDRFMAAVRARNHRQAER